MLLENGNVSLPELFRFTFAPMRLDGYNGTRLYFQMWDRALDPAGRNRATFNSTVASKRSDLLNFDRTPSSPCRTRAWVMGCQPLPMNFFHFVALMIFFSGSSGFPEITGVQNRARLPVSMWK